MRTGRPAGHTDIADGLTLIDVLSENDNPD
jgi:hypothetical protein